MSQLTGHYREPETPAASTEAVAMHADVPGLAIALTGAAVTLIALFLKSLETSAFTLGGIEKNTLIQQSGGWLFVVLALCLAGNAYRAWRSEASPIWVIGLGVAIVAFAIYHGTASDYMTLSRLNLDGTVNTTLPTVKATPGIGIYAAGLGGVLGVMGGWILRRS
jgi:hypothetical protein